MICPILLAANRISRSIADSCPNKPFAVESTQCLGTGCKWFNLCNAIQQADNIQLIPQARTFPGQYDPSEELILDEFANITPEQWKVIEDWHNSQGLSHVDPNG